MSKTTENIIVIIIMVAIVVGLLCFVGIGGIKNWLSTPFVWKEPDFLSIQYAGTLEEGYHRYVLLEVENRSEHEIRDYEFQVLVGTTVVELSSLDAAMIRKGDFKSSNEVKANGFTTIGFSCNGYGLEKEVYDLFNNLDYNSINNLQYRVVKLESTGETLFSNNGWIKIITILIFSLVAGLLGLVQKFPVWLRIILKVCSLPIALCLIIVIFCAASSSSSGETKKANSSRANAAQQRYNRAANQKAGAIKTGNVHSAAKAQAEMDKAMAEMIAAKGAGNRAVENAAARYKREADLKAGATITGRGGDAAKSQANMDKAMAEMMHNK